MTQAKNTSIEVTIDFNESNIKKTIASIYEQLGLTQYVPYANLDGLDDVDKKAWPWNG